MLRLVVASCHAENLNTSSCSEQSLIAKSWISHLLLYTCWTARC